MLEGDDDEACEPPLLLAAVHTACAAVQLASWIQRDFEVAEDSSVDFGARGDSKEASLKPLVEELAETAAAAPVHRISFVVSEKDGPDAGEEACQFVSAAALPAFNQPTLAPSTDVQDERDLYTHQKDPCEVFHGMLAYSATRAVGARDPSCADSAEAMNDESPGAVIQPIQLDFVQTAATHPGSSSCGANDEVNDETEQASHIPLLAKSTEVTSAHLWNDETNVDVEAIDDAESQQACHYGLLLATASHLAES